MTTTPIEPERLGGIWSATPTPLTADLTLCVPDIDRLVQHHVRLGVRGLFLAGTCGEGPWLKRSDARMLLRHTAAQAGDLVVAAQVTDNSAPRILENMEAAAEDGADIAVIAPPHFLLNPTPDNVRALYLKAIRNSPLPVGIYDLGSNGRTAVPGDVLAEIYAEPNVVLVKDSSCDPGRRDIALKAREQRTGLRVLTGYEFDVVSYFEAGYDGALLGGGIFNARLAAMIMDAVRNNAPDKARALQERMNRLMWDVYGGESISCWLTGLKELLVRIGVFSTNRNLLNYPLTDECSTAIDQAIARERNAMLP
jgi:4-hydroxy-tetrahydrodipicolinate synthase